MNWRVFILLLLQHSMVATQGQVRINGKVINSATKTSMPAVSVQIKGSNLGTFTDKDGQFSIETVSEQVVLVFSTTGAKIKELIVHTNGKSQELGIVWMEEQQQQNYKGQRDTISIGQLLGDSLIILKLNKVSIHAGVRDLLHFLDSIADRISGTRREDLLYGINYIRCIKRTTDRVILDNVFIKTVGMVPIQDFIVEMIEKGSINIYDKKDRLQKQVIRVWRGRPGQFCWYGREFYLPGTKEYFIVVTDIVC